MTEATARELVQRQLEAVSTSAGFACVIPSVEDVAELGWVFFWNSRAYVESGEVAYALGGNGPYVVDRRDGSVHRLGTASSVERQAVRRELQGDRRPPRPRGSSRPALTVPARAQLNDQSPAGGAARRAPALSCRWPSLSWPRRRRPWAGRARARQARQLRARELPPARVHESIERRPPRSRPTVRARPTLVTGPASSPRPLRARRAGTSSRSASLSRGTSACRDPCRRPRSLPGATPASMSSIPSWRRSPRPSPASERARGGPRR